MPTSDNEKFGGKYLKPAEDHNHRSWHCPEMSPLFPYELYGLGLPDLELMKRTSLWSAPRKLVHVEWESHEGREGQGDSKDGKT